MIFELVKCVDHPPNQNNMFTVNVVYFSILWGYHRWAYCERRRCLTCSYSSYSGASLDFSAARTWNVVKLSNIWRITGSLSDISNHILPINISHPSIYTITCFRNNTTHTQMLLHFCKGSYQSIHQASILLYHQMLLNSDLDLDISRYIQSLFQCYSFARDHIFAAPTHSLEKGALCNSYTYRH